MPHSNHYPSNPCLIVQSQNFENKEKQTKRTHSTREHFLRCYSVLSSKHIVMPSIVNMCVSRGCVSRLEVILNYVLFVMLLSCFALLNITVVLRERFHCYIIWINIVTSETKSPYTYLSAVQQLELFYSAFQIPISCYSWKSTSHYYLVFQTWIYIAIRIWRFKLLWAFVKEKWERLSLTK